MRILGTRYIHQFICDICYAGSNPVEQVHGKEVNVPDGWVVDVVFEEGDTDEVQGYFVMMMLPRTIKWKILCPRCLKDGKVKTTNGHS